MNIFKKKQSKLSRRITWRVIMIVCFINVLIIGAILGFVFMISTMIGGMLPRMSSTALTVSLIQCTGPSKWRRGTMRR